MNLKKITSTLVFVAVLALNGCGGSGATEPAEDSTTTANIDASVTTGTGYYVDAAVSGVQYKCGNSEGNTSDNGAFTFEEGKDCTFSLAGIILRVTLAAELKDEGTVFEDNIQVAQLLQSIDFDGNLSNGIQITPEVLIALTNALAQYNGADDILENNVTLAAVVSNIGDDVDEISGEVRTETEVEDHLSETKLSELLIGKTFYLVVLDNYQDVNGTIIENNHIETIIFGTDGNIVDSWVENGQPKEVTIPYSISGNTLRMVTPEGIVVLSDIEASIEYLTYTAGTDSDKLFLTLAAAEDALANVIENVGGGEIENNDTIQTPSNLETLIVGKTFYVTDTKQGTNVFLLTFDTNGTGIYGTNAFNYEINADELTISIGTETFVLTNVEELVTHLRFTDATGAETSRFFFTEESALAASSSPTVDTTLTASVSLTGNTLTAVFTKDMQEYYGTTGDYDTAATYWQDSRTLIIEFNSYLRGGTITFITTGSGFLSLDNTIMDANIIFTFPQ